MDELDSLNLFVIIYISLADVAELADAIDLGSIVNRRAGSIPVIRTQWREAEPGVLFQESVCCGGKLHAEIVKK